MNFRQLEQLVAIADFGSLTRAASHLGISQPALTRSLQSIEAELGTDLFRRTTRRIRLTEPGRVFVRRARLLLAELETGKRELDAIGRLKKSLVVVSGSPMTASKLIPDCVARMLRDCPETWVSVAGDLDSNYQLKLDALLEGDLDVVVSISDVPIEPDGLVREELFVPELCVIARSDHPAIVHNIDAIDGLMSFPWILPPTGGPRQIFENEFAAHGLSPPQDYLEIANRQTILSIIQQSDFITALPFHPACAESDWNNIRVLPLTFDLPPLSISLITRSREYLTTGAEAFANVCKTLVREAEVGWQRGVK